MNAPEPKPAAALDATLIRRGQGRATPALAAPPAGTPGPVNLAELAIPAAPNAGGSAATGRRRRRRLVSWHSAGMFGVLYLAALALFAAAFDMWPR